MKTASSCFFTEWEDVQRMVRIKLDTLKSNARYYRENGYPEATSRPILRHKRYLVDGIEIGTEPCLEREIKYWLEDGGSFIGRIYNNGLNQVVIEVGTIWKWTDFRTHLSDPDGGSRRTR